MTRWARGGDGNRKQPKDATPWSQMKPPKHDSKSNINKGKSEQFPIKKEHKPSKEKQAKFNQLDKSVEDIQSKKKHKVKRLKDDSGILGKAKVKDKCLNKSKKTDGLSSKSIDKMVESLAYKQPVLPKPPGLAEQLHKLQREEGLSSADKYELSNLIHKEERSEQRRMKRIAERDLKKMCYHCRQTGHDLSSCPKLGPDASQTMSVCFKCGSTEHSMIHCKLRLPNGVLPYSKCFICGEQGHLSKQCPDNPRGLYLNGGCCRVCSSVEHYKKDCPTLKEQEGLIPVQLETFDNTTSADANPEIFTPSDKPSHGQKKKMAKVVKF